MVDGSSLVYDRVWELLFNFFYSVTEVLCCVFGNYKEAKFHTNDRGVGGKGGQRKERHYTFI